MINLPGQPMELRMTHLDLPVVLRPWSDAVAVAGRVSGPLPLMLLLITGSVRMVATKGPFCTIRLA